MYMYMYSVCLGMSIISGIGIRCMASAYNSEWELTIAAQIVNKPRLPTCSSDTTK